MVSDADFNGPQDLPAHLADRRAQRGGCLRGVPFHHGDEVLADEASLVCQSAPGTQRVFQADGCGSAEGSSYRTFIVSLQKRTVNDVEDLLLAVHPASARELRRDGAQLPLQPLACGHVVAVFQRKRNRLRVFLRKFPEVQAARLRKLAGVRHVKDVAQPGRVPGGIQQRNALRAPAHIAAHGVCPDLVTRAGRGLRTLGKDEKLFVIGVFVQAGGGLKIRHPRRVTAGNAPGRILRKLHKAVRPAVGHAFTFLSGRGRTDRGRAGQSPRRSWSGACG